MQVRRTARSLKPGTHFLPNHAVFVKKSEGRHCFTIMLAAGDSSSSRVSDGGEASDEGGRRSSASSLQRLVHHGRRLE